MGLGKDSAQSLDIASRGAFICLSISEARTILDKIIRITPCTSIHDELLEEEKESSLKQEEEVLIAISQSLQSQDLAISPKPSIPQNLNPSKTKEIQTLEILFEIKGDLFNADFGRTLNSHLHKRPSSEYISNPLKEESLRKPPYSHIGYWKEFKDGMSSEPIEGKPSHLEITHPLPLYAHIRCLVRTHL
jgi:hypothetical protein